MSIVEKDGYEYVDSGVLRDIPIREAISSGATEIDVIVLNQKNRPDGAEKVRNVLHLIQMLSKTFLLRLQSENLDFISLREDMIIDTEILINIYYTHRELTNNSLLFDSNLMKQWWVEGYETASSKNFETYLLTRNSVRKIK
jgi:predicted acylesterase/phospholipase RssA